MSRKPPPPPPDGLSERAQRVWVSEIGRGKSAGRLCLLEECLRHLSRADALAAAVEREGLTSTTVTTGAVHLHPLTKVEQAHRALFVKLAKMLSLEWDSQVDGYSA
jgi:hypothetical protein